MNGASVILGRELLALLRSTRVLAIFLTVAAAAGLVVFLKWPTTAIVDLDGSKGREVFRWLTYAMLAAAILVVPVFPSTLLVREVRRRAFELLLNSPLSRSSIYFGKLLAMLGFVVLLLATTLPAMACAYLMGGLSLGGDVLRMYGFLLLVSTQLIIIGLLVGTWCRNTESALRWSYGVTFGLMIVPWFPDALFPGGTSPIAKLMQLIKLISPIPGILQILNQSSLSGTGLIDSRDAVTWYLGFAFLFITIGSLVCISRFSHALLDRARSQGFITDDQDRWIQASRRILYLVDPQRRSKGIPWLVNPVMVKEFQCRQFGRMHWLLRLVATCAVLSLLLTLASARGTESRGVEYTGALIIVLQVSLIVLLTPGLAAGMIASEIEGGSWNLLRSTPLGPLRILFGKLVSVIITLALLLCATLPGYAVIMLIKPILKPQVEQVMICLAASAALSMLVSAAVSSLFRTTAIATTVAYGSLIALFGGTMLIWVNRDAPFGRTLVENSLRLNPMAAALNAMQASGFEDYNLIPSTWWFAGVASALLLVLLFVRTLKLTRPD
jgi:ABC-type transport system involved in multi-copper enzyme maturation permease subunit